MPPRNIHETLNEMIGLEEAEWRTISDALRRAADQKPPHTGDMALLANEVVRLRGHLNGVAQLIRELDSIAQGHMAADRAMEFTMLAQLVDDLLLALQGAGRVATEALREGMPFRIPALGDVIQVHPSVPPPIGGCIGIVAFSKENNIAACVLAPNEQGGRVCTWLRLLAEQCLIVGRARYMVPSSYLDDLNDKLQQEQKSVQRRGQA